MRRAVTQRIAFRLILVLAALTALDGCAIKRLTQSPVTDQTLLKLSRALEDASLAVGGLQSMVIVANKQATVSDANTEKILVACYKVNVAGKQASAAIRGIAKLTPADRTNLTNILQPAILAIGNSVQVISNDPKIQDDLRVALLAVQTGLTLAQTILVGGA